MILIVEEVKKVFVLKQCGKVLRRLKSGKLKELSFREKEGYLLISYKSRWIGFHRILWILHFNEVPVVIDHRDGNKKNNSIDNLRNVDNRENLKNQRLRKNNKSGFSGVRKYRGRWRVEINGLDGKRKQGGSFVCLIEAANKAKELYQKEGYYVNHGRNE